MGTIQYSDNRDKKIFVDASLVIGKFITGKNNPQGLSQLKNIFLRHVESVTFTPFNNRLMNDLGNTSTIGPIRINSVGCSGINNIEQEKKVRHAITHELLHAHVAAIQKENPKSYHKNGNNYIGVGGYICNADDMMHNGAKRVYGIYYMEAMTELLINIAMSAFDAQYKAEHPNINANTILRTAYNGTDSKYDKYLPMVKLMIEVFSNWDKSDYYKVMQDSDSQDICSLKIKTDTNRIIQANDLLYGYMYNPIHSLEKYDSVMGDNAYIDLLKNFDQIKKPNNEIDKNIVEKMLHSISEFSVQNLSNLVREGILYSEEATRLLNNIKRLMQMTKEQYSIGIGMPR